LKLILECGLLNVAEMQRIIEIADEVRIKWLKTGTGFNGFPATVPMVQQLRTLAPEHMKIKAAGGIKTLAEAKALLEAGADRIGTSASMQIIGK
jgi:deoxyribose-phosphate aldolase